MEKQFTPELIEKAKRAKSAEELMTLAKENGVDISEDEARKYFDKLNKSGELSDDELNSVSGGGCIGSASGDSETKFKEHYQNKRVRCNKGSCAICGSNRGIILHVGTSKGGLDGWCDVYCYTHQNQLIVTTHWPEDDLVLE